MRGPRLKYLDVRDYLRSLSAGPLEPGDPVPSERKLCDRFGVSRMTVRHAVDTLVVEGLLERVQGRGTFVARPKVDLQVRLTSFAEEMQRRGMRASVRNLRTALVPAAPLVAAALGIKPGQRVVHLHQLQLADSEPISIQHSWLTDALVLGLLDDGPPESLYVALESFGLLPDRGEDTVDAGEADAEEAALLGVQPGRAVLRITRRAFRGDIVAEYTQAVYRGDRYSLSVPLTRPSPSVLPRTRSRA